jgi:hypothetical protein
MPRTDKRVEDEFAVLVNRWKNKKRRVDSLREGNDQLKLQGELKSMKTVARQMKKMLDGNRVLG